MPDYILIQDSNHKWQRAAEQELPDEAALQQLIRENPDVLPLDDLGDETPPLMIVGRETQLPNGLVDVIGVDSTGKITLIECKLDRNPEVKRKVVGQILGYAAYLWGMNYQQFEDEVVRKYFDSAMCHRADWRGIALENAMQSFIDERGASEEWNTENFRQQIESNLEDGRFRLIIVVDKVNQEMQRTVEFLNSCTGPNFDIFCAELRYFGTEHTRLLVPALIGKPLASKPSARTAGPSVHWNPEIFFPALEKASGPEAVRVAQRLLKWCMQYSDRVYWGTGSQLGSFNAIVQWNPDRVANIFGVWTYGKIEIGFQYISKYPPFNDEKKLRALLDQLNSIKDVKIGPEDFNRRPSIPIKTLAGDKEFQQFTEIMKSAINELRASRP